MPEGTDYLVIGAGLAGLGFVDALIEDDNVSVVIVDRRHAPGGHWLDSYPFVRLHLPSRNYGVYSMPLGEDRILSHGADEGLYERASGTELCGYFDRVMQHRLLASGRVTFLPMHEYIGHGQVRSRLTGQTREFTVRKRLVDATYSDSRVPATHGPPFDVATGMRCVAPGELPNLACTSHPFVIIGAGKTAMDTCQWLLGEGVDPERICWVRPRDMWLLNRVHFQGGRFVKEVAQGALVQQEAAARSTTADEYFEHCNAAGLMLRVDPGVRPSMIRGSTSHPRELELLSKIDNVVRLGRVKRIERDRIVLDRGEIPTTAQHVHVNCAVEGITVRPPRRIFEAASITLQAVRVASPALSAALIGFLEASGRDAVQKNRLAQPNPYVSTPLGWVRANLQSRLTEGAWKKESDLKAWLDGTPLNLGQGVAKLAQDPQGLEILQRIGATAEDALASMQRMVESGPPEERALLWAKSASE